VSNFYIVDLENFATASRWYTGDIHNSTVKGTQTRHGLVHMFITHWPTLTLQLHNFDLFRTCRTDSFCTVAWQLARFQLTRRIARSLGDSWVSCWYQRFFPADIYILTYSTMFVWDAGHFIWQEAQLSPRNRAMRRISWNIASCHATVQKLLLRQVLNQVSAVANWLARQNRAVDRAWRSVW